MCGSITCHSLKPWRVRALGPHSINLDVSPVSPDGYVSEALSVDTILQIFVSNETRLSGGVNKPVECNLSALSCFVLP